MRRAFGFVIVLVMLVATFTVQAQENPFTTVAEIDVPGVAEGLHHNMSLSPDGRLAAVIFSPVGNADDETPSSFEGIVIYETQTGDALLRVDLPEVRSAAFSPDSTLLAVSGEQTLVFDVAKLVAYGDLTVDMLTTAAQEGVIRNQISTTHHMILAFTPDNRALYGGDVAGRRSGMWDISAPTDFSDPENIVYPQQTPLAPQENHRLLPMSIVSGEQGLYAVTIALLEDDRPGFGVFMIAADGTLSPAGMPYDAYADEAYNRALGTGVVSANGRTFMVIDGDDDGADVLLMRMQDDGLPAVLSTLRIGEDMPVTLTPDGDYAVYARQDDGRALRLFHDVNAGADVAELEVIDALQTELHFSAGSRFAVLSAGAEKLIIYDAVGLDLSAADSEDAASAIDSLALGMGVPVITDPADCAADAPGAGGDADQTSTCVIGVDPLMVDTPFTLGIGGPSLSFKYPSALVMDEQSAASILLASSEEVLGRDFSTVPPMAAGEAAISILFNDISWFGFSADAVSSARDLAEIYVSQFDEISGLALDGAVIDTFAADYPAAVAYFKHENGDVMFMAVAFGSDHYAVIAVISATGELALIEPTIYEIANTFVFQSDE